MKARRFLILIPILILAFVLSGCIQTVVSLDIKEDLSADVDIKVGIDEDYYDMVGGDSAFSEVNLGESEGFIVSSYSADGFKGMEAKGSVSDLTSGSDALGDMMGNDFIRVGQTSDGKKTIELNVPANSFADGISGTSGYSMEDLSSYGKMDLRLIVTLPYEVKETNATSRSGNTLTWDLLTFEGTEMTAYAEQGGFAFPIWLIIVIIVAAAAVVAIFLLLHFRKNKQAAAGSYAGGYGSRSQEQTPHYNDRYNGPGYNNPEVTAPESQKPYNYNSTPNEVPHYDDRYNGPGYNNPEMTDLNSSAYSDPEGSAYGSQEIPPQEDAVHYNVPAEPADAFESEEVSEPVRMNFCPKCGSPLPENGHFCPKCGYRL